MHWGEGDDRLVPSVLQRHMSVVAVHPACVGVCRSINCKALFRMSASFLAYLHCGLNRLRKSGQQKTTWSAILVNVVQATFGTDLKCDSKCLRCFSVFCVNPKAKPCFGEHQSDRVCLLWWSCVPQIKCICLKGDWCTVMSNASGEESHVSSLHYVLTDVLSLLQPPQRGWWCWDALICV